MHHTLSPLRPATTLPRLSEMRPWQISCICRPLGTSQPARPVSLTIYALGMTMALCLAHRQLASLNLCPLGSVTASHM